MKLFRALLGLSFVTAVLLGAGCNNNVSAGQGTVSGPQDLALFYAEDGGLLVVTSTDTDELRVLDLTKGQQPDFMRAPNPIQPLSIPVLSQPTALARDIGTAPDGGELTGLYAFARSAGSTEISVVSIDRTPSSMRETTRLVAPAAVTAFAARMPDDAHSYDRLYFATYDGSHAALYESDIAPREADGGSVSSPFKLVVAQAFFREGESVLDILAIPGSESLAIATRYGPSGGRTFRFVPGDVPADGNYHETPLLFPSPTRKLKSHWAAFNADFSISYPPGARIFAILDEASCGGAQQCTGIYSVENIESPTDPRLAGGLVDASPSKDVSTNAMVPIVADQGSNIIEDFQIQPFGQIYVPCVSSASVTCPNEDLFEQVLLGTFTTGGTEGLAFQHQGGVFFFDASALVPINVTAAAGGPSVSLVEALDNTGAPLDAGFGTYGLLPGSFTLFDGMTYDGTTYPTASGDLISAVYQAPIPGVSTVTVDGGTLTVSPATGITRVENGDLLVASVGGACDGGEVAITRTGTTLTLGTPLPAGCPDPASTLTLRADGPQPYVVTGQHAGYLGRFGTPDAGSVTFVSGPPESPFGAYYRTASTQNVPPAVISFPVLPQDPAMVRDGRYVILTQSNFYPESYILDPTSFYAPAFSAPTGVTYFLDPKGLDGAGLWKAYALYPAANRILEVPVILAQAWLPQYLVTTSQGINTFPPIYSQY